MTHPPGSQYYVARRVQLLRNFDRFAKRLARHLVLRFDETTADAILGEARTEFDRVLPQLPFIGGRKNLFTPVIVANGWFIALWRAMRARGARVEDLVQVCCQVSDDFFRSLPPPLRRLLGWLAASRLVVGRLRRQAERSQERRYPEDFVFTVRAGGEDDVALELSECAVNKLYAAQGVEELKPYCNFFDVTYSRLLDLGLDASETIGLGCATCRLRYKRGRETIVPRTLVGLLPGT